MTVHPKHDSGTLEYRGKEVPTPSAPLSEAQVQCGEGRSVTIPLPGWRWLASWTALHTSWHLWFNQAPLIPPSIKAQHRNHKLPQPLTGIVWLKPRGTLWKVISVLWIQGPLILLPGFKWSQEILQQGGKTKKQQQKLLPLSLLPPLKLCCGLGEDICEYGQRWVNCRRAVYSFVHSGSCSVPGTTAKHGMCKFHWSFIHFWYLHVRHQAGPHSPKLVIQWRRHITNR